MAKLTQVIAGDLRHVSAVFNASMDQGTLQGGLQWSLTAQGGVPVAVVTNATPVSGQKVDLVIGPAMTAGANYTLQAVNAKDIQGNVLPAQDNSIQFQATEPVPAPAPLPDGLLSVLTRAVGEEVQVLSGRAVTRLVDGMPEDGPTAFVETTLGFPDAGAFFVNGRRYAYSSRTPVSFNGCVKARAYDGSPNPVRAEVHNDPFGAVLVE